MADITMPQLGETVTEGTITKWMKQVGDQVAEDEVLYEVSTDKVDSEVPSPVAGYLAEIVVAEGDTAEVGAKLAVISDSPPGGAGGGAPDGAAAEAAAPAPAEPSPDADGAAPEGSGSAPVPADPVEDQESSAAEEVAKSEVEQMGEPEPAAPSAPAAPAAATTAQAGGASQVLSPVVRRLIAEHGLDPAQIAGTGVGGRITRADVLKTVDEAARGAGGEPQTATPDAAPAPAPAPAGEAAPAPTSAPAPAPAPARRPAPAEAVTAGDRDEVIPFSNIRRRTAEHMVRSRATSAHTLVAIEVDYENVDKVRRLEKERFRELEGVSLTYLPFIARATVDAIHDFPQMNASVGQDQLVVHRDVNLGIAVDMDFQGLIVPVVQGADGKRLRILAKEVADLGRRAKSKKLSADEIAGGTFTITNAGGYGTLITGAIINQPQVAILSTDGVKPQPVAVPLADGGYGIAVHPVGNLALTWDHRAVDGAYAAAFLARIKETLETRDWSAELS